MSRPARVALLFAVREELAPLRPHLSSGIDAVVSGMGVDNARLAAERILVPPFPQLVLTCGFAGGLNPAFPRNTVLFEADPDPDTRLVSALRAAGAVPARFHCSPRVIVSSVEKQALHQTTGADAVEMESAVIRDLCQRAGVASATVRVISDAAHEDLPVDFNQLLNSRCQLDVRRLAWFLVRNPGRVRGLLRLQRHTAEAARALAQVLRALLADA